MGGQELQAGAVATPMQEDRKASIYRVSRPPSRFLRCAIRSNQFARNSGRFWRAYFPICTNRIDSYLFIVGLLLLCLISAIANAQVEGPLKIQKQTTDESMQDAPPVVDYSTGSAFMDAMNSRPAWPPTEPPMPELPAQVAIPTDRPLRVTLETPLSTRISKQREIVTFRLAYSILLGDGLEIPPDTEILGHVVELKKPGSFGKPGLLRVTVDRIRLDPDGGADVKAHVDSAELRGQSQAPTSKRHPTDLYSVMIDSAGGAILGGVVGGAKGAAIGAGTGAGATLLIKAAHRGDDVYIEPGSRFSVVLEQPVYLSGAAVYAALQKYKQNPKPAALEPDAPKGQPKLKRRPPPQN